MRAMRMVQFEVPRKFQRSDRCATDFISRFKLNFVQPVFATGCFFITSDLKKGGAAWHLVARNG